MHGIPEHKPECVTLWAHLAISHFITTQIKGQPHYMSWGWGGGQGEDTQRKTILNSGYLVMVEICMIFSFSFFLFSRKCRGWKPSGIMGKSVSSGAWLQMIIVIPSLVVLLLPSFSYSLNLAQQLEGHFSKIQVRPYSSPLLQTLL